MARSRLGLKALGLCALVLGLMVVGESGVAQAEHEPGAAWGYMNGTELKLFGEKLEPKLALEIENGSATLLIATNPVQSILCTGAEFDEGGTLGVGGLILLGRIKFTGCVFLIGGKISKPCEPHNGTEKGVILTEKGEGLILLHVLHKGEPNEEKDSVVLLKRDPLEKGEVLVTVHLGEECSVGEEILIEGELVVWDCKGNTSFKTHAVSHLIEEFPGLRKLHVGINAATIDGSANVSLAGEHKGLKWAGLAG